MFVVFEEGIRSRVVALETLKFGGGALACKGGMSNEGATLLPGD